MTAPRATLLALALALVGCDPGGDDVAGQAPLPVVTVAPVASRPVQQSAEFVGRIEAVERVELRARVEGFLQSRTFIEGSFVRAGDILFQIDPAPFEAARDRAEADVASALAAVVEAQKKLDRAQQLIKRGNISQASLDAAQAEADQAAAIQRARQADARQAEIDLSYTTIVAPIAGRIDRSAYSIGNLVSPQSGTLATVTSLDPIYVTFSISERDFVTFAQDAARQGRRTATTPPAAADAAGQAAGGDGPRDPAFAAQAGPDEMPTTGEGVTLTIKLANGSIYGHEGALTFIDSAVDPQTGTILLRGTFPNPDGILVPGQFVTVSIRTREAVEALTVPQAAIQRDQQGAFVLVVDADGTVQVRRIRTGARVDTDWIVEDGLSEGELLIVEGLQKVRPGMATETIGAPTQAGG